MNRVLRAPFLVLAACLLPLLAAAQAPPASFAGVWEGKITTPMGSLRVVFHVDAQPDGSLKATMDSPDQGATGIPMSRASADKNTLRLECQMIQGSFYGSLGKDGTLSGQWSQGGAALPLVLKRVDKAPGVSRPQEPKAPLPYKVEDVTYPSRKAGVTLAATLTLPEGPGPFPAVLLVAGSGPTDRDETVFGHKPFLVLADALTRRGIAVLRADKRGMGGSTGDLASATDADFVDDALGGVDYLASRKEVNAKAVGVVGHSEGGLVAARVAAARSDVAFIVLLASPGLPGRDVMLAQQALLLKAAGADEATLKAKRAVQEKLLDIALQEKDDAAAARQMREILKPEMPPGAPESAMDAQITAVLSPWYRDFLAYDPRPALAKVKCPVLALGGQKDLQVAPIENLTAIRDAVRSGGNQDCTVKLLPGLNHLFQTASTGLPTEYGTIEETLAPQAIQAVGDWIVTKTRPR